ncbi:MAG: hypothetical protein KatS3mg105_5157 [Gemmatales bacterium]|nr:MAG: hypothetical protein KatS3mg105_5119 [Gemmatales bacterium]GIW83350.1 MAG: hypothetical protein KatS3mg105_5157 [Gemmatales bacterium]GIW97281.1 MAG: hypothetical protein KatS3mg111_0614 [Pirellulaceae bacterium]GIX00486.1 MAG: hypothetical protein KatS3mg111_3818 [Pirellulaceae bacterium]GIX01045.1 MAG: hypothetical protein KatS3mg111_4377 [Pirellulaceae bacterium]
MAKHPRHRRRKKPYLTDHVELGRAFRKCFVRGLRRLLRKGTLKLGGSVEFLNGPAQRDAWLNELEATDWNVFIEGPPSGHSDPANVIKYLARYLTGGPIADSRIIRANQDEVWFWARPKRASGKKRRGMHKPRPFRLAADQFMTRWTTHILPKGFTRSRSYGGYHSRKRKSYLNRCRELQCPKPAEEPVDEMTNPVIASSQPELRCPRCEGEVACIQSSKRPSWRQIFDRDIYQVAGLYSPMFHVLSRAPPRRPR